MQPSQSGSSLAGRGGGEWGVGGPSLINFRINIVRGEFLREVKIKKYFVMSKKLLVIMTILCVNFEERFREYQYTKKATSPKTVVWWRNAAFCVWLNGIFYAFWLYAFYSFMLFMLIPEKVIQYTTYKNPSIWFVVQ